MKILYVDDSAYTRKVMKKYLSQGEHETTEACSAEEALEILAKGKPDLLLTDLLMDGMGGLELLRRALAAYPDLRVVVVSADAQETTLNECLAIGAKAFYTKGHLFTKGREFLELLERVLQEPSAP
jgi:CheY-like chemotaxis protein